MGGWKPCDYAESRSPPTWSGCWKPMCRGQACCRAMRFRFARCANLKRIARRSEEHTSELQSQFHLVCRLLLEKKKTVEIADLATVLTGAVTIFYYTFNFRTTIPCC